VEVPRPIPGALGDRREFGAELVGSDVNSDLAVLKIAAQGLHPARLGQSRNLKVGEWVLAIGSPFGLQYSVAAGIISYMGRSIPTGGANYVSYIQTDVAIICCRRPQNTWNWLHLHSPVPKLCSISFPAPGCRCSWKVPNSSA